MQTFKYRYDIETSMPCPGACPPPIPQTYGDSMTFAAIFGLIAISVLIVLAVLRVI